MNTSSHPPIGGPEPERPADTLAYTASALDDVRRYLDAAQAAATTALVWVRVQQARGINGADGQHSDDM